MSLDEATAGVLGTLPPWCAADRRRDLERTLRDGVQAEAQLEASLRVGAQGRSRAGRVMVEGAPLPIVRATCAALGMALPVAASRLAEASLAEGVPLIAGWDVGGARPAAKLYANASDASVAVRRRLAAAACLGPLPSLLDAPNVIGLNLLPDRIETKLYLQNVTAAPEGTVAQRLEQRAAAIGASAGTIVSWDLGDTGIPANTNDPARARSAPRQRAFFVATRRGADEAIATLVEEIPGWAPSALSLLPFHAGVARSIGVSPGGVSPGGGEEWTIYYKPIGADPVALLDPTLRCRAGAVEVAVFVEPDRAEQRAYLRTGRHAVSYRPGASEPDPASLRALMLWVGARVRAAEAANRPVTTFLVAPPSPWSVVA